MVGARPRAQLHLPRGIGRDTRQPALLLLIGVACVTGAAASLASYTSTEWPHPAVARTPTDARLPPKKSEGETEAPSKSTVRLADVTDDWLQALQSSALFRMHKSAPGGVRRSAGPSVKAYSRRAGHKGRRPSSEGIRDQGARLGGGATYRTMCVRLCDGYYWPVSFAATRREFARDGEVCARSCDAPAALHVYRNPGEEPEDMVDLSGRPYAKLGNAFRHRVGYDPACKCRPHPWETSSRLRHSGYLQR
jgi:Protein of unknown function (DUF2865)